jgi:Protein of unknown function (DUF1329)
MNRSLCSVTIGMLMALATAASAQQFNPRVYAQMVDASSPETIAPGTKISVHNWTKYKNFFPYFIQLGFQGQSHFRLTDSPDYVVEVGPTEVYPFPKAFREDTEKYAGQTRLVPDPVTGGFTWTGYKAGVPFSNPTGPNKAAEIMYNAWAGIYQPFVLHEISHNWLTDAFGNVEPEDTDDAFYRPGHLSDPPYPMNQPDSPGALTVNRFIEVVPEQAKYTTALEIVTDDPSRMTEEYVFLPSLRRSLRLSSASRCAPILGTDFLADDSDWKPAFFRPELIGEKKILVPLLDEKIAYTKPALMGYVGGDDKPGGAFPGWPKPGYHKWQVRKAYLVNMKATEALGRGYCYTQRIFYIDPESWRTLYAENYDRGGKLYHIIFSTVAPIMYQGQRTIQSRSFAGALGWDWQNNHATSSMGYDLAVDQNVPAQYRETGITTPGGLDRVMK